MALRAGQGGPAEREGWLLGGSAPERGSPSVGCSGAAVDSLARLTRPDRIGWQRVDVHLRMTDQRHSLPDRLSPDEAVAL